MVKCPQYPGLNYDCVIFMVTVIVSFDFRNLNGGKVEKKDRLYVAYHWGIEWRALGFKAHFYYECGFHFNVSRI